MGFMDRLLKRKEAKPMEDEKTRIAKQDALKIVAILRSSRYASTMEWDELVVRFRRTTGTSNKEAVERLQNALAILTKSSAIGWGGLGSAVSFSRTTPIVVI